MTLAYSPATLAAVLHDWLAQFPEKVLFGSDATALGPDAGWEITPSREPERPIGARTGAHRHDADRRDQPPAREEHRHVVMRTNAGNLYGLELK